MEKKEEKLTFSDKLGKWIYKNRVALISVLAALFVVGIASAIIFSVVENNTEKKYAEIYALETEYSTTTVNLDLTEDEKNAEFDVILNEVLAIASANGKSLFWISLISSTVNPIFLKIMIFLRTSISWLVYSL